ncbi:MAG: folylpolyglutamate synthase/dihydrofolate synthase family protein [Candidatus Micrarchaeota archaeon]
MPFSYSQAVDFIEMLPQPENWPLERMKKLVEKAGIDFEKLGFIHVTGSNGKGSVSAMLYSILRQDGKSVGLYSSPHLTDWRERFLLDGKTVSQREFARLAFRVKKAALQTKASQFEVLTAIALLWFAERKPDWLVWEVGLGGRLDATNVVNAKYAVITPISLEHTQRLGKTLEKIAWEKSKIIKQNSTAVTPNSGRVLKVIAKEAKARKAKLVRVSKPGKIVCSKEKTSFAFKGKKWGTKLLGFHQAENAATAIAVAREIGVSDEKISKGLLKAHWPGRMEVFSEKPLVVLDGAHNPAGVKASCESFVKIFGRKPVLVVGILADKEWKKMARSFASILNPSLIIATQVENERRLEAGILEKEFKKLGVETIAVPSVKGAVRLGMEKGLALKKTVFVSGSLYAVGEVLSS